MVHFCNSWWIWFILAGGSPLDLLPPPPSAQATPWGPPVGGSVHAALFLLLLLFSGSYLLQHDRLLTVNGEPPKPHTAPHSAPTDRQTTARATKETGGFPLAWARTPHRPFPRLAVPMSWLTVVRTPVPLPDCRAYTRAHTRARCVYGLSARLNSGYTLRRLRLRSPALSCYEGLVHLSALGKGVLGLPLKGSPRKG